jgi:hypothetical protein
MPPGSFLELEHNENITAADENQGLWIAGCGSDEARGVVMPRACGASSNRWRSG